MTMNPAELQAGAAELRRLALLEQAVGGLGMAAVRADLDRPRNEWLDPRTANVVDSAVVASTTGFTYNGVK